MIRLALLILTLLTPWLHVPAGGGDVAACFSAQDRGICNREALQHIKFKSVVLQFVDPGETDLGEGLARVFWREILDSISDLKGAGVIIAYDRDDQIKQQLGEQDVQTFLQQGYHQAALKIAEFQKTQMAAWGAILNDGDGIYLQSYLSLREASEQNWMQVTINFTDAPPLSVPFIRPQYNLPPITATRSELFSRRFFTRCNLDAGCAEGIELRSGPANDFDVITHVAQGSAIDVVDMHQQWLQVKIDTNQLLWINLYHVEMFPEQIRFDRVSRVNLRQGPMEKVLASVNLDGQYNVLDAQRYGRWRTPWYKIKVQENVGWIRSDLASSRQYMFGAVHLIAGFYRYNAGQYDQAIQDFSNYLLLVPDEDNVTRANVLKLLAASELAGRSANSNRVQRAGNYLRQAAEYTPFDASVYTLQALLHIADKHRFDMALPFLIQAQSLNPQDPSFIAIEQFLKELEGSHRLLTIMHRDMVNPTVELLRTWEK
ncbi:MAG: tetratricopeptide (TPR) repeat protein [Paraglaciecola sp.]|jgi:tetratricopeptide (TPR) repeat protein